MLKLFHAPRSCSLAAHIALEQSGLDYDISIVDFAQSEQRQAQYLKVNPKGRVPALVTDQGVLTENPAILMYIALTATAAKLIPDNPFELSKVLSINAYLSSTVHVAHAHGHRGYRWADDESAIESMSRKMPENMAKYFEQIENTMIEGPWVLGQTYSIADIYLFTISGWLKADGVDINLLPKVKQHREKVAAIPAVKKVIDAQ
ncbi:MAG: glutathione S-transferase family protein [Pseudomonadales bacterium]|nr:glutathione S-transferase family protein [Pseudomonadales bacterium]MDG1441461.1 glutathione S-transferase family protein [Pseudomonadales bacterium]